MQLTMPEEIMLLLLDDRTGRPIGLPAPAGDYALSSAILMELSLQGRVDTDLERLMVTSQKPTDDPVLDEALIMISSSQTMRDSRHWIVEIGRKTEHLRSMVLDRLTAKGVLRREEGRFLWVFPERRYPKPPEGQAEVKEVRARLRDVLLHDEIPEPREALMIGLARSAGLIPLILSPEEQDRAMARVDQVADLEELGRTLSSVTREVYAMMLAFAGAH
ncbi:GOLPH3/VPS74 family protein [Sabulicella glaciei]|uniref:GPP34 family phosphoprotein n=1 Tax=Sabulicella glaciei TaxID=2984948 RepID=A0ABT3NZU7_9PROT|nr:GPP34 family phosphoprotein [Roseococcus sp. MDT2-1-1]MCW8087620.1 GPP34 family phosphoprotein [Roseococcus sp. MDT2-1-1]